MVIRVLVMSQWLFNHEHKIARKWHRYTRLHMFSVGKICVLQAWILTCGIHLCRLPCTCRETNQNHFLTENSWSTESDSWMCRKKDTADLDNGSIVCLFVCMPARTHLCTNYCYSNMHDACHFLKYFTAITVTAPYWQPKWPTWSFCECSPERVFCNIITYKTFNCVTDTTVDKQQVYEGWRTHGRCKCLLCKASEVKNANEVQIIPQTQQKIMDCFWQVIVNSVYPSVSQPFIACGPPFSLIYLCGLPHTLQTLLLLTSYFISTLLIFISDSNI
jgi:hypothetical protein